VQTKLCQILQNQSYLNDLSLTYFEYSQRGVKLFSDIICTNAAFELEKLTAMVVDPDELAPQFNEDLFKFLKSQSSSLKELHISRVIFSTERQELLLRLPHLEKLHLSCCIFTSDRQPSIQNVSIECVTLSENEHNGSDLPNFLKCCKNLHDLELDDSSTTIFLGVTLGFYLSNLERLYLKFQYYSLSVHIPSLKVLHLSGFDVENIQGAMNFIHHNRQLRELRVPLSWEGNVNFAWILEQMSLDNLHFD
jgi:hypothetical protein